MATAAKTWDKKTIYQSELVKASQREGLAVMFTGPVRDSKYAGKPPYIGFKVYGDESDYTLNIENDHIRSILEDAPKDMWLVVRAEGSRDSATILLEDANGNPVWSGVPANEIAQPKQPQDGPPPMWPEEEPAPRSRTMAPSHPVSTNGDVTVQRAVAMTVQAVQGLEQSGIRVDSDAAARIYNTHFIQATR